MPTIAILGASADRSKFGNKAVRAFLARGFTVYPVNPKGGEVEGLPAYRSLAEIPAGPVPRLHPTAPSLDAFPGGARLEDLRVMVVDDDPDALVLATAIIGGAGAVVRGCGSASEALDTLLAAQLAAPSGKKWM